MHQQASQGHRVFILRFLEHRSFEDCFARHMDADAPYMTMSKIVIPISQRWDTLQNNCVEFSFPATEQTIPSAEFTRYRCMMLFAPSTKKGLAPYVLIHQYVFESFFF